MRVSAILAVTTLVTLLAGATQSADVQLRAAQQKETVEGDLHAAIAMYRKIADDRSTPPEVAARALVRLGRCYQRMGSAEARKAFERVVAQFGSQTSAVAEAKQLLASIENHGAAKQEDGLVVRKLKAGIRDFYSATITSDGKYMSGPHGGAELEVLNLTTGERTHIRTQQPLTTENEQIYSTAISPDGQRIAVDIPKGPTASELKIVDRSTGQVRVVFTSKGFRVQPMDWSRDGRTLLARDGINRGLYLIDAVSGTSRPIPPSASASYSAARLSPDGLYIAYTVAPLESMKALGKIFVQRIDGSGDELVADPEGGAMLAGWSRDGKYLLFASDHVGTYQLWAVRIQGGRPEGNPLSLAKGLPAASTLNATTDGSVIMRIEGSTRYYIAQINPTTGVTGTPRDLNSRVNATVRNLAWSPDGSQLVYSVVRDRPDQKPVSLHLRDERTGEERKLGSFDGIARIMTWTPDGQGLLLPQSGGTVNKYWLADGRIEQLVSANSDVRSWRAYPKLTADGQTLYYTEGSVSGVGAKLIRHDLRSGKAVTIATVTHSFDLAPDGKQLAIPSVDVASKTPTLRIITTDGQPVRDLVRLKPEERIGGLTWSARRKMDLLRIEHANRHRSTPSSGRWWSVDRYRCAYDQVAGFGGAPERDTSGLPEAWTDRDVARGRHQNCPCTPRGKAMNRIVVVEDEPGIALALEDSLRLEGHDVEVISDGGRASERLHEAGFDLILLDVMLPGKDGLTICSELRAVGVKTPIVLLTARAQEADRVLGLDLGASDYVVKPFSPNELMARVRRLLRQQADGREDRKQYEDELRAAVMVQEALYPRYKPPVASFEYSAASRPARVVSGDYYDFIPLEDGKLGLMVADVCGKGLSAAFLGASLHGALRAFAPSSSSRSGDVLKRVNRIMYDTTSPERYATAFYGVFDPATQVLTYANAGHCPSWLVSEHDFRTLGSLTPPLGMFANIEACEVSVPLTLDDWLTIASDGITEATNEHGESFNDTKVVALVKAAGTTPEVFCREALDTAVRFGVDRQTDDLTILAARVTAGAV
jgi:phosphoserine phosphatase RsbU/P